MNIKQLFDSKQQFVYMKLLQCKILFFHRNTKDSDIAELLRNLKEEGIRPFLGDFTKKYNNFTVPVYREENNGHFWVMHNGEKLFFSNKSNEKAVSTAYMKLCREQDIVSPHRYVLDYSCLKDCYVIEAGAAEASFSLDALINGCKKVYICECSKWWISSLQKTFEKFNNHVQIIEKYVSDSNSDENITIDTILENAELYDGLNFETDKIFIKMDIEGMEEQGIRGMQRSLKKAKNIMISVCAYHNQDDESKIRALFSGNEWHIESSHGYMLFPYDQKQKPPYFRKGILRITKNKVD